MRYSVSAAPGQLRQGAQGRGRGWQQLLKPASPAAGASFLRTTPADYWERLLSMSFTLVTSAAAGLRSLNINLLDGDGYVFNSTPISNKINPSTTITGYADIFSVTAIGAQQIPDQAQATAAAAGNATATLPVGAQLTTIAITWGNVVTANNVTVTIANLQGGNSLVDNVALAVGANPMYLRTFSSGPLVPAAGQAITVTVTGNANSPTAVITAVGTAPQNSGSLQVQLPDLVMKSGWQLQLQLAGAQAADQLSAIGLLLDRFPSSDIYELEGDPVTQLADAILARGR